MLDAAPTAPNPTSRKRSPLQAFWAHRWFFLALALALSLGGWEAVRVIAGPAVVVDAVRRGNLVETIVASGHVETPFRVEIGSQITGTVTDVLVDEGQHVTAGQKLILLDAHELKSADVEAESAVALAEARLRQLDELTIPAANETLKQAQANLVDAQHVFDRASTLAQNGFATQAAAQDAQKNLDIARTQVRVAELQVRSAGPGGSDHILAETQLRQAHASLETAGARLDYATITAPRDGVLISRTVERGTVVQAGKALLVLAPSGETQLVLQIDERNLGVIKPGLQALASADAYPDQRFDARVSFVNPAVDISRASVEVKLNVPSPPDYLRQDMSVSVDVEVARRDNALVLSARSVHDALSSKPWVMALRDGRAYAQPVKLGIRGNTQMEILEGVAEHDMIIPATSGVLTGQRIRPVAP